MPPASTGSPAPAQPDRDRGKSLLLGGLLASLAPALFWYVHQPAIQTGAVYAAAGLVALVALFVPGFRRPGAGLVLGMWTIAIPATAGAVVLGLKDKGESITKTGSPLPQPGLIMSIAVVVLLAVALARACGLGGWLRPRGLGAGLLASMLLSTGAYQAWMLDQVLNIAHYLDGLGGNNLIDDALRLAAWTLAGTMMIVAVIFAVYALCLQDGRAGGMVLLGMSVPVATGLLGNIDRAIPAVAIFGQIGTTFSSSGFVQHNTFSVPAEAITLIACVTLTIIYITRSRRLPLDGGG